MFDSCRGHQRSGCIARVLVAADVPAKGLPLDDFGPTGDVLIRRRLNDGSSYRAVKVPHCPADLEKRLRWLGWEVRVSATSRACYWGKARSPQLDGIAGRVSPQRSHQVAQGSLGNTGPLAHHFCTGDGHLLVSQSVQDSSSVRDRTGRERCSNSVQRSSGACLERDPGRVTARFWCLIGDRMRDLSNAVTATNGTAAVPKFNQTAASSSVMHVGGICTNVIFCTLNDGNRDLADSISIAIDRGGSAGIVWTDQGRILHGPTHITYGCVTGQQTAIAGANQGLSCKGPVSSP
jgi:hypothetical protein